MRIKIDKVLDKPLTIWGIYAPTNAKDRRTWLKSLRKEIQKDIGYKIIAGDFNFIMNPALDKRRGRTDNGTIV